jgi:hypothetical protein
VSEFLLLRAAPRRPERVFRRYYTATVRHAVPNARIAIPGGEKMVRTIAAALALILFAGTCAAAYPDRAVRFVVPVAPGGPSPVVVRDRQEGGDTAAVTSWTRPF